MTRIVREIVAYDANDERWVEDIAFPEVPLDEIRMLFHLPRDDEVMLCYEITDEQRPYFESRTGRRLTEPDRVYFLEAHGAEADYEQSSDEARASHALRDAQDR